jgi:hypothetical protein
LGGGGGDLGYYQITNSVALELNIYFNNGVGIAFGTNGNTLGSGLGAPYAPTGGVVLNSGDPIDFKLNYANGNLSVQLTDSTIPATFTTNYAVGPLTSLLGGTDLAYVGFSGGDGGAVSIQTISNFAFNSVIPPVSLSVSSVSANSFVLSWPATGTDYYQLQTATSLTGPWSAGPTPTTVGGVNKVTILTNSGSHQFYRLVRIVCQ